VIGSHAVPFGFCLAQPAPLRFRSTSRPTPPPASYYVIAKADADNVEAERRSRTTPVARLLTIGPDLVVSSWPDRSTAAPGGPILATDTVKNQGGGAAGATTTRFYLSANANIDATDLVLGSRSVFGLAAGSTSSGSTSAPDSVDCHNRDLLSHRQVRRRQHRRRTQELNNYALKLLRIAAIWSSRR